MNEESNYYTFARELLPEGRRVFALSLACDMLDTGETSTKIMKLAKIFETWLKEAETKEDKKPKHKLTAVKE